jgi:hypothetical protein
MSGMDRAEAMEAEVVTEVTSASTALVPVTTELRWLPKTPLPRPDPSFVTQLIATADRAPQTCALHRGSSADAQAAYGPHIGERRSVTRRTRQII